MKPTHTLLLVAALCSLSCAPDAPQDDRFIPVADLQTLMAEVVEPAAFTYWRSVGWILDEDGEHEIYPRNEEEWERVHAAAYTVTEAGNLMMMEGRALDDGPFIAYAQAMIEVGKRAIEVAEAEDLQGIFDVGAELYFSCTACHTAYALDLLPPSEVADSLAERVERERNGS